jgi:hypothetical protein
MEVSDVYWSDWGEEQRMRNDIENLDLKLVDSFCLTNAEMFSTN